jgi:hypothetical protein
MKIAKSCLNAFLAVAATLVVFLVGAGQATAQEPIPPERLPAKTTFYLIWRGTPPPAVRQANSLLALWDDPDFASVRSAMATGLFRSSESASSGPALKPEEITQFSTLLENSFVLGYISEPEEHRRKRQLANDGPPVPAWNGMFFVYDRTGKETLLANAVLRLRQLEKEPAQVVAVTLAGVTALKVQHKDQTTYWAETGKFAVSASEPGVFEEIVSRLRTPAAAGASLGDAAAFHEAQPQLLKKAVLEFFLRVPSLKEMAPEASPGKPNVRAMLDELHLETVHSICASVGFEGPRTRIRGAVLGDASEGTLFDLWPNSDTAPASLSLVPADAVSYSATRFDFSALYRTLHRVFLSLAPEGQAGMVDMIEGAVQARIGMPLPEALALLSGEFASVNMTGELSPENQVYILGIRKKPEILRLMRMIFSDRITSERTEGDATLLKIAKHGTESSAGSIQWGAYHVAVTPDLLIGASTLRALRTVLAQRTAAGTAPGLAALPQFLEARSRFPRSLNGLGFFDVQRVDWQALKNSWLAAARKPAPPHSGGAKQTAPAYAWLDQLDLSVISRHLHTMSSASWKDAKGVRFDGWID